MSTKITTDWHIGVSRSGGTTPESLMALRARIRHKLAEQLCDEDHIIAGDLFDAFTVDHAELMSTYSIFAHWLATKGKKLVLLRGNHDYHPSATKVSSFDLLGHVLATQFPDQVVIADAPCAFKQFILIPHMGNQELFRVELNRLISAGVSGKVIVLHANIDNPYAAESEHSLNVTCDALELLCENNVIVCGHEHQHRILNDGRCVVLGNGYPSSVADCLGADRKYAVQFDGLDYTVYPIWYKTQEYGEVDWRDIGTVNPELRFVRIVGSASVSESADAVNAIAVMRRQSTAFVITNAVEIDGVKTFENLERASIESIHAFDVKAAILEQLTEEEQQVVKGLFNADKN